MDINYFSNKPLLSVPGATLHDPDLAPPPPTALDKISRKLGLVPDKTQIFSLPNAKFLSADPSQRIKLSIYEAKPTRLNPHRTTHGTHRQLAFTIVTVEQLRTAQLGHTTLFVAHEKRDELRSVGTAALTEVEHGTDPRYFRLRASLPNL
jgi:hypothetical protein